MSTAIAPAQTMPAVRNGERAHRFRLLTGYVLAVGLLLALAVYGWDYYTLAVAQRPFSAKHSLLKPSGVIGLKLGFLGLAVFFSIFLYPIRKHWPWLMRQGSTRHWLDIHVLLGLMAPFIIAFHASFKFQGFAGIAFWIMAAVSASGVVGRYLYAQIPRQVNAAELSRKEIQDLQAQLAAELAQQKLLPQADWRKVLQLPSSTTVERLPVAIAIVYMMMLDAVRFFRVAKLRRRALQGAEYFTTGCGFFPTSNRPLERAIATASEEAALSKRILFLSRSEKVFHLWHVVHKPFSYTFAILAAIHIAVVMMMGYM
jgi:hypothetical protein